MPFVDSLKRCCSALSCFVALNKCSADHKSINPNDDIEIVETTSSQRVVDGTNRNEDKKTADNSEISAVWFQTDPLNELWKFWSKFPGPNELWTKFWSKLLWPEDQVRRSSIDYIPEYRN